MRYSNTHGVLGDHDVLQRQAKIEPEYISAPSEWKLPATSTECTIHQLAPYIGKLKSSIAKDLLRMYSRPGDLIVDPFAGSGTIPLEALLSGRQAFASDISSYSATLTRAKLSPPLDEATGLRLADDLLSRAAKSPAPDLRRVPAWVRQYFHPTTLKETLAFARACKEQGDSFMLACLLGILHHQRPGFLSYPSSHLVPYLRDRKYPRDEWPDLYGYRPLRPRLFAKIKRALRRTASLSSDFTFEQVAVEHLTIGKPFDAMITSPPYMNALDYRRDNRLRLWFLDEVSAASDLETKTFAEKSFSKQIAAVAGLNEQHLRSGGHCVLIVGESVSRGSTVHPAGQVVSIFGEIAQSLTLEAVITDSIPDIRRSRRECRGVKKELVLVFTASRGRS